MYECKHKITYYDLDMVGCVKLSALLKMVHIAADVNASDLGIGFKEMSALNMTFILQRFAIRVTRMPTYAETVRIRTWPDGVARGTFTRKGDMYCESGKKIMEWASLWILFDIEQRRILKPSALPVVIPTFEVHGVEIMPEKISLLPETLGTEISKHTHTVRYADVDTNMHMNNSIYGDLIGNALFFSESNATTLSQNWREIQINYLSETRLGEEINITTHHKVNEFVITGQTGENPVKSAFAARVLV